MNRKLICLLVITIYFSPSFSFAQKIDSMMKVYAEKFPQEKLYLHFDKKAYNPGDRIWYKAYLFSGYDPSLLSKNFYAELYDAYGNLILRNTAPIKESTASGNFDIPASFEGTRIHIRAYTTWMLNFDSSFVFTKDLRIIGSSQDSVTHTEPTPTSLHFFPEGGDLVAGTENSIAFKAEDGFGQPRKVSGILYDQSGKEVLNFNSTHNGMGKFLLALDKPEIFYALWKDEKGIEQRTDLPTVKATGITLRVLNAKQKLIFSVSKSAASVDIQKVIVIAHMNQQMIYKAVVSLKDVLINGGNIATDQLPTGILQVTVFDLNQMPLAERVSFINNHSYAFDVNLTMSSKNLQKRGRNVLDVELPNSIKSDLSISITDAEVDGNRAWDENIISNLLLTGDLHGFVKNPYYYFRNNSDTLAAQLDLVMLTHGWRRFKWQDLAKGKSPVIKYPIEDHLSLDGEVFGVDKSRIAKDENLIVIFKNKDSTNNMLNVPMVAPGKFHLGGLMFYDTAKAYYQFNINRNLSNEAAVIIKNGLYSSIRKYKPFSMTIPAWSPDDSSLIRKSQQVFVEMARLSVENKKMQSLEAVTIKRRIKSNKEKMDELYSSGLFSGGNATILDVMGDRTASGSLDLFSYLQGKVAGLQITTSGPNASLTWRGSTPALYLDEMPVEVSQMKTIPMANVAMVKVFAPGSASGISNSGGGVISVYTKKGQDVGPDPSFKGLESVRIPGYSPAREFYSPDYLINPEPETDDIRTTLYWNPNFKGDKGSSRISIPFYNSDVTHHFRVIVEGYNEDGKLTHSEKIFE